ncbi:MAG: SCO family protein [Hyphomicrobium sp.]|uniref:SCO family protein n=1 Tax=Hyphomicrobium sp. TaxID=82 RepID=UPI0013264223|nr:SCO family protein [Hyphomicrobium sp.]KAB2939441.1 MAG: SCO family protein [Hyphomicrobium sp.]MBZ0209629.1 SCO family protein [Hyphomicrobium sp.]MCZ7595806.1 SCO family protein [Hyphomicrobium sp.]
MRAKLIASVVAGVVLGAVAAIAVFPEARQRLFPQSGSATSGKALIGGPFTLMDATGKTVTDQDYRGRYMLVFFGFTGCPDICPAGLQLISAALDKVGPKADKVTPIFISVDPERDTPEKLAAFVKNFDDRLVGLTGTPEQVAGVAKAYRVFYEKTPNESAPAEYGMNHTSIIYLMGPDGEYVTHFTPATSVDAMAEKLGKLL